MGAEDRDRPDGPTVQLPSNYPLPPDQMRAEIESLNAFEAGFPQSTLLQEALASLNYFVDGKESADRFTGLRLKAPVERDADNIAAAQEHLSIQEQSVLLNTDDGMVIVGALPRETEAMLHALYGVTGASVERDDRPEGKPHSLVIRRGEYHGSPVHFMEYYDIDQFSGGKPTLSVKLVGEGHAQRLRDTLSGREREDFMAKSGLRPGVNLNEILHERGVTRGNYAERAAAIRRQLADEGAIDEPPQQT